MPFERQVTKSLRSPKWCALLPDARFPKHDLHRMDGRHATDIAHCATATERYPAYMRRILLFVGATLASLLLVGVALAQQDGPAGTDQDQGTPPFLVGDAVMPPGLADKETLPPGLDKKLEGNTPPGRAKETEDRIPPGIAKKGADWVPPGLAKQGKIPPGHAKRLGVEPTSDTDD